jgi:hypothetical protein
MCDPFWPFPLADVDEPLAQNRFVHQSGLPAITPGQDVASAQGCGRAQYRRHAARRECRDVRSMDLRMKTCRSHEFPRDQIGHDLTPALEVSLY